MDIASSGKEHPMSKQKTDTGGGAFIGGNVNTNGGDFVGRDKNVTAGQGGVAIGGNASNNVIVTGDNNVVSSTVSQQQTYIQQIFDKIDRHPDLAEADKTDLKSEVKELQAEDAKGEQAREDVIARRLRNIRRMAPDILEVVLATIANPAAGFGVVAKKVAEKMQAEAG
jgi:hypothetical protein